MNDGAKHIGYLIAYPGFSGVACQPCVTAADPPPVGDPTPVKLYDVNVYPYKQTCHGCGKTLVEARSHHWPELFVKQVPPGA